MMGGGDAAVWLLIPYEAVVYHYHYHYYIQFRQENQLKKDNYGQEI